MKRSVYIALIMVLLSAFILSACGGQEATATPVAQGSTGAADTPTTAAANPTDTQPAASSGGEATATSGGSQAATGEPIMVGVLANLTGPETSSSQDMVRGVELAITDINNSGGINGRPIKSITEDAEYRPEAGVDAAHKLIDVNKVPVILNVGGSGIMLPVGQYAQTKDVVVINTGASSPQLRTVKTLCSVVPLDDIVGKVLGEWAYADGYRNAMSVVPNSSYGKGVQDNADAAFEAKGGKVVGQIAYTEGQADYRPEVQQITNGKPDAILSATYGDDGNLFLKQTHEAGLNMPWYVTYPTIINVHDPASANGRLFGLEPGWDLPVAQHFMKEVYGAKYGAPPTTPWANYAYDGMMLVALAMRQNGITGPDIYKGIPQVATSYNGVTGPIHFDGACQRTDAPLVKLVYKDGKLQPVESK